MKKTIGGDRLGAGKKNEVELKAYERSTHDMGYIWRSTMSSGTLVPFMSEIGLPGDTFDIELDCNVLTHPTIGPLFGSYKVQLDIFSIPIRLYNKQMIYNALNVGLDIGKIKFPQIRILATEVDETQNIDNQQINPSSILSYLNIRGVGRRDTSGEERRRDFNAIPYLAYWDIYKNYYANKQEEEGVVIHSTRSLNGADITEVLIETGDINSWVITNTPTIQEVTVNSRYTRYTITGTNLTIEAYNNLMLEIDGELVQFKTLFPNATLLGGTKIIGDAHKRTGTYNIYSWQWTTGTTPIEEAPKLHRFPLENIDNMREAILEQPKTTPLIISGGGAPIEWAEPYAMPLYYQSGRPSILASQEGLGIKTYQSDLFNNWISTEWIDGDAGINTITAIDTSEGSFTIDTLNLSKKVYNMLNRVAVSGGSFEDYIDAVYTHERRRTIMNPMYEGGLSKELVFQEVIANAESADQPLGTLAGRGVMSKKHKGGKAIVKTDEASYIMGIVSLTPRIDYSQGNKWDVNLKTMADLHKPALDQIGFQDLITDQMAWWDTYIQEDNNVSYKSAGKQPAWINYMTNVNQVRGNFAIQDNEMFMTLNRRYEFDPSITGIGDLTTYIDPTKFNHIFAETAIDAQNFWVQIGVNITARRKISAKVMPNL